MDAIKQVAIEAIDAHQADLNGISQSIWNNPELGFQEQQAHTLLTNYLEKSGFEVARKYPIETSFVAKYSQGSGPRIGIMVEYDALPGIGHACGHNLIAEAGIAASIGLKHALQRNPALQAEVVVFGTPAEEGGGGKCFMIEKGVFKDIDACMMVHPYAYDIPDPIALAITRGSFTFHGKAAHAAASPWDGVNALDAAVACYNSLSMLRQQSKMTNRIHCVITDGGEKPNIIPRRSQISIYCRGVTNADAYELRDRLNACAQGAATATGCTLDIEWDKESGPMYEALNSNRVLLDLYMGNGSTIGMKFDLETDKNWGSTDAGNVSNVVPTIQPCFSIPAHGAGIHTEAFAAAAGLQESQHPTLNTGKAMAMTAIDLITDHDLLQKVKQAFSK